MDELFAMQKPGYIAVIKDVFRSWEAESRASYGDRLLVGKRFLPVGDFPTTLKNILEQASEFDVVMAI
jgi:hypothetical protein